MECAESITWTEWDRINRVTLCKLHTQFVNVDGAVLHEIVSPGWAIRQHEDIHDRRIGDSLALGRAMEIHSQRLLKYAEGLIRQQPSPKVYLTGRGADVVGDRPAFYNFESGGPIPHVGEVPAAAVSDSTMYKRQPIQYAKTEPTAEKLERRLRELGVPSLPGLKVRKALDAMVGPTTYHLGASGEEIFVVHLRDGSTIEVRLASNGDKPGTPVITWEYKKEATL